MQEGVSVRHMMLKVLYTFDDANKTNCLTRWPQVLNIQTAFVDDVTEIGVVELQTCIQAIVQASPELVHRLGQDYTVYAYDYSEYDTPLVGQGMLACVLAAASSTSSTPANQSRTIVTGRVCKNILGLFSNGIQETLEVRFRLVPVQIFSQSEYLSSLQRYRELSNAIPQGSDAGAWTLSLKADPAITQMANQSRCESRTTSVGPRDPSALELVQTMLFEGDMAQESEKHQEAGAQHINHCPSYTHRSLSMPFGRPPSPTPRLTSARGFRQPSQGGLSRPTSTTSERGFLNRQRTISNSSQHPSMDTRHATNDVESEEPSRKRAFTDMQYLSNPDGSEGPARKRAKVTAADWSTKSTFGNQRESLRVAASTAASVRIHQPKPIRPSRFQQGSLERPPKAPTPVPNASGLIHRRTMAQRQSRLRTESHSHDNDTSHNTTYDLQQDSRMIDPPIPSPEESQTGSTFNTPPGIASSPPLIMTTLPARSSPVLPFLQRNLDPDLLSGTNRNQSEQDKSEMYSIDSELMSGINRDQSQEDNSELYSIDSGLTIRAQFQEDKSEMYSIASEEYENASRHSNDLVTPLDGHLTESNPHSPALPPNKKLPNTFVKTGRAVRSTSTVSNTAVASAEEHLSQPPRPPSTQTQTEMMSLPPSTKALASGKTPLFTSAPPPGCAMERASSTTSVSMHQVLASGNPPLSTSGPPPGCTTERPSSTASVLMHQVLARGNPPLPTSGPPPPDCAMERPSSTASALMHQVHARGNPPLPTSGPPPPGCAMERPSSTASALMHQVLARGNPPLPTSGPPPSHAMERASSTTSVSMHSVLASGNPPLSASGPPPSCAMARTLSSLSTSGPPQPGCAMERSSSTATVSMHPVLATDPARPCSTSLQRSNTWSGQQVQHPASDAPTSKSVAKAAKTSATIDLTRSGSGARRKKAIQQRLATSIAAGEMPPYCENCGAIETPTWRKAWVRIHSGTPEHVEISNAEGGVIAWEALQRDRNGTITLFRIIKRSLLSSDAGFTEILLCNPCGLWLNKSKAMRPKEKWTKVQKEEAVRPKRPYKTRKAKMADPMGARHTPIVIDEETPAPPRRLLATSPRAAGEGRALQTRSPNAGGELRHDPPPPPPPPSADQADKENRPPPPSPARDRLPGLFEEVHRPATPPAAVDLLSSAAKALSPTTPTTRSPRAALGEMTPFTAQLSQLLDEANAASPTANLDFGALAGLEGAEDGMRGAGLGLGEGGFFALYEDPVDFSALMEGM